MFLPGKCFCLSRRLRPNRFDRAGRSDLVCARTAAPEAFAVRIDCGGVESENMLIPNQPCRSIIFKKKFGVSSD